MNIRRSPSAARQALGALLAAAIAVTLVVGETCSATADTTHTRTVHTVWDLPRGADTSVPYLAGRELHVGAATYTVPDQSQGGDYRVRYSLVGRDARGRWLVGVDMDLVYQPDPYTYRLGSRARLLALTANGATMIYDELNNDGFSSYFRLNDNRSEVVLAYHRTDDDSFADTTLRVLGLDGSTMSQPRWVGSFSLGVLDASGPKVILGGTYDPARVWTPGVGRRLVTKKGTAFADMRTHSLAVAGTHYRWAMATLTHPHHVRWQAWFAPVRVSPNGKRVVGIALSHKNGRTLPNVQVRQLASGRVLAHFPFPNDGSSMVWNGNRAVVFAAGSPAGSTWMLVRCGLGGRCARVSDAVASFYDPLGFAFEPDVDLSGPRPPQ